MKKVSEKSSAQVVELKARSTEQNKSVDLNKPMSLGDFLNNFKPAKRLDQYGE